MFETSKRGVPFLNDTVCRNACDACGKLYKDHKAYLLHHKFCERQLINVDSHDTVNNNIDSHDTVNNIDSHDTSTNNIDSHDTTTNDRHDTTTNDSHDTVNVEKQDINNFGEEKYSYVTKEIMLGKEVEEDMNSSIDSMIEKGNLEMNQFFYENVYPDAAIEFEKRAFAQKRLSNVNNRNEKFFDQRRSIKATMKNIKDSKDAEEKTRRTQKNNPKNNK